MAADPQSSPLSQLLNTLGITKEDLSRRSDQMREFLTSDSSISSRLATQVAATGSPSRPRSRSASVSASLTRQIPHGGSHSARDASPSPAPTQNDTDALPSRTLGSMEAVLERQRLSRKQKRSQRHDMDPPSSPTRDSSPTPGPSSTRETTQESGPSTAAASDAASSTPPHPSHHRDHTSVEPAPAPGTTANKPQYPFPYYYYPSYPTTAPATGTQFVTLPFRSATTAGALKTPVKVAHLARASSASPQKSPLPPSSPPVYSSPASSPVNVRVAVSSPAGADDALTASKSLPYTLPPGPYSEQRPHHSYAGIIGQAILSSTDHRLTLQEIYDWICIVYPHFKRGERTWMNSIRHVLSTTVHFRKVTRDRSAGRSYWAIFDDDLDCFANGGYRKPGSTKRGGGGITTASRAPRTKKRTADEIDEDDDDDAFGPGPAPRKSTKRQKNALPALLPSPRFAPASASSHPPGLLPDLVHPNSKPGGSKRLTSGQQTYYESCVSAAPSYSQTDILFPRLPKSRLISSSPLKVGAEDEDDAGPESEDDTPSSPTLPPSSSGLLSSSPSSVPALTPHASSSSPMPLSEPEEGEYACLPTPLEASVPAQDSEEEMSTPIDDPAKSGSDRETLQPGIDLELPPVDDSDNDDEDDVPLMLMSQANKLESKQVKKRRPTTSKPRLSSSPSLHRRKTATAARSTSSKSKHKKLRSISTALPPPPPVIPTVPSTPPRGRLGARKIYASPTPVFRNRGPPSPSAGFSFVSGSPARISAARDDIDDEPHDPLRTPSRKGKAPATSSSIFPVTPKRLLFPSDSSSPFRTPGGNMLSASPFRTPGSAARGGIFDPHDPSTLLAEELRSYNAAGPSPTGLYDKGDLYSSPNPVDGSPGKWARWW
ncbi:Forkhead box protein I1 [Mycena kentingensis (nom. inval.)]|nr:Forkhead box protein I1 [Mycena kentingensis (nom. inval.)]